MSKASVSKRQKIGSLYVNVVKGQDKQVRDVRNAEEKPRTSKILIEMDNLNEVYNWKQRQAITVRKVI